ncbi:MAG: ATP-binding protein [Verrucomicrobia bacterium]|nr:ATP-binding protein [Cytophagales bacterium]
MVKKIVLFGSESTGKTTLAESLASYYNTVWVPEFAREYLDNERITVVYEDVIPIAQGQLLAENSLLPKAHRFLFCDTNILETKVYAEAYFGKCPDWLLQEIDKRQYDFYLLTNIDLPWVPDALRDRPHQREAMHELFKNELLTRKLPVAEISGIAEERLLQAIEVLDNFFD